MGASVFSFLLEKLTDALRVMGAQGPRMKLKGRSIGPRTEDEVERSQH